MNANNLSRFMGICGVVGATLFFVGDMLFYGHWGSGASARSGMLAAVRDSDASQLFMGGWLGLPAACLCLLGCWHLRQHIVGRTRLGADIVFASFAATIVQWGAVHELWAAQGLAMKFAGPGATEPSELASMLKQYWAASANILQTMAYVPAVTLIVLTIAGKTDYPRWMVLANFGLLALLEPLASYIPAPLGAPLAGGFSNLALAVFFLAATLSTWSLREIEQRAG
jgi:hypothetical protein